jgi:hypothetical protein
MPVKISFEEFSRSCEERDYEARRHENHWYLTTNNGIKCELKTNHYTVAWRAKPQDVAEIRVRVKEAGFTEKIGKRTNNRKDDIDFINIHFEPDGDMLENFWVIVGIIEGIESIVKKIRGQAIKPIAREVSERNIFEKIAKRFKFFIDSEDGFGLENIRALLEGDSIDHLITIGESVSRTKENSYREHIVPCVMIYNKAVEMTLAKSSITEIAQMIKNNLGIVLITNQEADYLDHDLDLQTTMPEGWEFGNDVFARLKVANIQLK